MENDGLALAVGLMLAGIGFVMMLFPTKFLRYSKQNTKIRLDELGAGAPEAYFEERRELEAYSPRFNFSDRAIRLMGLVQLVMGTAAIVLSF